MAPQYQDDSPRATVEVWTIDLAQPASFIQAALESLSPEDRSRADAFKQPSGRDAFIIAHAALRQLLAARLQLAPNDVPIQLATHGKPQLAEPFKDRLHFNLSHSGGLALVTLCDGMEVGVDVEHVRPVPEMERLTKRFFTPTEGEAYLRLPAAERTAAFFRLWTRKEALLKATGQGIAHGLERFEVSCEPEGGLLAVEGDQARAALWTLRSWSPAEGYVAAVAVPQPGTSLHCHKFEFD